MSQDIRVRGTLKEPARVFTDAGEQPSGFLRVLLCGGLSATPVLAVLRLGNEPSALAAAHAKAAVMRVGTRAELHGSGFCADHDHGTACLRLLNVTEAIPLIETHHQEPSHDAA